MPEDDLELDDEDISRIDDEDDGEDGSGGEEA